jgi:hypothetical protein
MAWDPTESVLVAPLVAVPPLTETAEPKFTPSIRNWTVPVGVPVAGAFALTVAVNVTGWPNTDGFADEVTVVVVAAMAVTVGCVAIFFSVPVPEDFVCVVNVYRPAVEAAVTLE